MAADESTLNALWGSFVTDLGGSFQAISAVFGDRLGLYRSLLAVMPGTAAEVAADASAGERYVSEWLKGQVADGYVTYDPATRLFSLTEEQAFALASPDGMQIAAAFHLPVAVARSIEPITDAVRTNTGFGWHQHDPELFEGTERFFRPGYVANLVSSWIPALDGVDEKLRSGAKVADVGCGHGASTLLLGGSYPRTQVVGFDHHAPSIEAGAQARGRCRPGGPGLVRGGRRRGLPRYGLRPRRRLRRTARHARPARRRAAHSGVAHAGRDVPARRALCG